MRLHDLRHVAASLTLANGGSLVDVMRLLGHSSIAVTVDTYGHLVEGRSRELADVMDRLLG
jgi:integrase